MGEQPGGAANQAAAMTEESAVAAAAAATMSRGNSNNSSTLSGGGLGNDAMAEIEAALDNFACAARSDTDSMAELVKSNAALVQTNEKLAAEAAKAGGVARKLHDQLVKMAKQPAPSPLAETKPPRRNLDRRYKNKTKRGPGGDGACGVCGWDDHEDARCFERPENAASRLANWKSCL